MQFLPTSTTSDLIGTAAGGYVAAAQNAVEAAAETVGHSFRDVFDNAVEYQDVTQGVPAGFRSSRDDFSACTTADMNVIEQALREKGVSEEALENLKSLKEKSANTTVGMMLNAMRGTARKSEGLTDQEQLDFVSLMQKLGFTPDEANDMLGLAEQGRNGRVMQAINAKLGEKDGNIDLFPNECNALLRALDVSPGAREGIMHMFANKTSMSLNSEGMSAVLAKANKEIASLSVNSGKMAVEAQDAIQVMLEKARQRKNLEAVADRRGSKRSDQSEKMMRDSATGTDEDKSAQRKSTLLAMTENENKDLLRDARYAEDKWHEKRAEAAKEGKKVQGAEQGAEPRKQNLNKAEAEPKVVIPSAVFANDIASQVNNASGRANFADSSATGAPNMPAYYEKLFSQVERGILQNAIDGSHKITMRLDPPELGHLSLTLSVNKGELKAVIRTENAEATGVIAEQLAALKSTLEDQGFKVSSLEVETRLQENPGENLHSREEQQAKEEQLRENVNFFSFSRGRVDSDESLARNVQNILQGATNSHQGLHVVA